MSEYSGGFPWSTLVEHKDDLGRVCCPYCGQWNLMERSTYYTCHYLGRCLNVRSHDADMAIPSQENDSVSTSEKSEEISEEEEEDAGAIMDEEVLEVSDEAESSCSEEMFEEGMNCFTAAAADQQQTNTLGGEGNTELQPQNTTFSYVTSDDWNAVDGPKGTVAWFRRRLGERLHINSGMKVLDLVLWSLERKIGNNMSRKDFNAWMGMLKTVAPDDALIPPSWHVVKNIAGVGNIYDYMYHVCGSCFRYRYGWIPAAEYERNKDEKCPHCSSPRFRRNDRGSLEPNSWVFYLGLTNALDFLFGNPSFVTNRGKARQYENPSTWYGSNEARRQNNLTGGALFSSSNSSYSLFVDAFQVYKNKSHSIGVVFLRCDDLDYVTRSKRQLHVPIMVIPGPHQPDVSWIYMDLIANDFAKWGPDGDGYLVTPAIKASNGCIQRGAPFRHKVLLSGIDGDTPAAQWVGQFVKSSNAYLSCFYCKFCGDYDGTQKKMVYGGYTTPVVAQHGPGKGKAYKIGTRDERRLLSDAEQRQRADVAVEMASGVRSPSDIAREQGAYGWCAFAKRLKYVDYNLMRRIPITHSILLGLCKRFWKEVFRWKSGGGLKPISKCIAALAIPDSKLIQDIEAALTTGLVLTPDFNRPFSGLNLGLWTSEDWMRWVEVYSPFVQRESLGRILNRQANIPPIAETMWGHLRAFALHHLQPDPERYSEKHRIEIRRHILEFGKLATDHAPSLLLPNLHKLACFAHIQEANCGLLGHNNELWGERALLPLKNCARNAKRDPDVVVANTILVQLAKATLQIRFNRNSDCVEDIMGDVDVASSSVDGETFVCNEMRPPSSLGGRTDTVDVCHDSSILRAAFAEDHGVQGKGRDASTTERCTVCNALKLLVQNDADVLHMLGLIYDDIVPGNSDLAISIHSYAFIHQTQTITSAIFERSQTRDGSVVQVRFDGKKFAGRIQYYATVRRQSLPECGVTFALCKFYANAVEMGSSAYGTMLFCPKVNNDQSGPWTVDSKDDGYPVLLDCIDTKYTMLKMSGNEDFHKMMFITYKFQSNLY